VNFSELSSIGAGAGERAGDVRAPGAHDSSVDSDASHEEGEFDALLDLLAVATQALPPPVTPLPQSVDAETVDSVAPFERPSVDATEIFRQGTALAAAPEQEPGPEPGVEVSHAFTALTEAVDGHEPPALDAPRPARRELHAETLKATHDAHEARVLVEQAIAAANRPVAAAASPATTTKPVAHPSETAAVATKVTSLTEAPVAASQPAETTLPAEPITSATNEQPALPRHVVAHATHVPADKPVALQSQPVSGNALDPAPQAEAMSRSAGGDAAHGDSPFADGDHAQSDDHAPGQRSGGHATAAIESFSPHLVARIYESAAAAVSSPSPDAGELADVVPQIVRSIHLQSVGDVGHARVHLHPENLGDVLVELRVEQGEVTASLEADVPEVREWIESRAGELRQALHEQGLELLHLSVRDREESRREDPREQQQPRKQKRRPDGHQGTRFELLAA
jgi:flagellar hook-length control protein FliK